VAKIAIDCDGVLANFTEAYVEVANKLYPGRLHVGYEPSDWDMDGKFTKAEDANIWKRIRSTENFWLGLSAYYDHMGSLARFLISNEGHDVYIVTSRAPTAGFTVAKQTEWWLKSCGIAPVHNYLGVFPVDNSNDKWRVYLDAGFDYSIDDKAETVEQCDFIHPRLSNHKAYLLDQKWNQHADVKRRVKTVEEFLKEISDATSKRR
jgi:5'(3')-deoxyribonucleotidase